MTSAQFDWDDTKNAANLKKHHVSFEAAQTTFIDPHRVIARDLGHSEGEDRFYLFWPGGGRRADGPIHLPGQRDSNHRRWVLA